MIKPDRVIALRSDRTVYQHGNVCAKVFSRAHTCVDVLRQEIAGTPLNESMRRTLLERLEELEDGELFSVTPGNVEDFKKPNRREACKMTIVTICVGSSCHIHGSEEIIERLESAIKAHGLEDEIIPMGGFCFEKCNRHGVTLQVDDDIYTGITPETFDAFFNEHILPRAEMEG